MFRAFGRSILVSLPDFIVVPIAVVLFGYVSISIITGYALGQFFKARDAGRMPEVNPADFSRSLHSMQKALGKSAPVVRPTEVPAEVLVAAEKVSVPR